MRPKIVCHMTSSVDGRLLTTRWTPLIGHEKDTARIISERYEQVAARLGGEGFIIGRKSMEEFDSVTAQPPLPRRDGDTPRGPRIARKPAQPVAVVIDPSGKLHYQAETLDGEHHIVTILSETVPDEYLEALRKVGVSYLFAGPQGNDLELALQTLHEQFGLGSLLLEGGGIINGTFLKAGLIDEISLLVYPGIDGLAGMPSIFDFHGGAGSQPASGQSLRHIATETIEDGFVWIRYLVDKVKSPD